MKYTLKSKLQIQTILSLILISLLFGLDSTFAATPKKKNRGQQKSSLEVPLIDKAVLEINKIQNKQPTSLKNSEPIGVFSVKEPQIKITDRSWKYIMGIKIQNFQPTGKVHSSIVGDFDLNNYKNQILPTLEFGMSKKYDEFAPWTDWNAYAQFGYNISKVPLTFQSGYKAPDNTRLNSMRANVGIESQRSLGLDNQPAFFKTGISLGKFFYSQTSMNDLAQFSENFLFGGLNLGITYSVLNNLNLSIDYIFRKSLQNSSLELQTHNLELGLRVIW